MHMSEPKADKEVVMAYGIYELKADKEVVMAAVSLPAFKL